MALSTDRDKVRLLISDVGGKNGSSFLYTDDEIDTFLALRPNVFQAAALALRAIAGNEAQTQKVIWFNELKTDGAALARELRALADSYDAQADDDTDFEIAQLGTTPFARRELRGLTW